ncbi:MAG: UDP-glucose/GDP-mannose dehydrogenase family protein [Candidatus Woesearchaeota archaeon]
MKKVSVIGTGYVGLVTGACLAEVGHSVVCVDNNISKIEMLRKGKIPIYEPGLSELVERNIKSGRLRFSMDLDEAVKQTDVVFIAVGTPPKEDGSVDLQHVENVAVAIGNSLNGNKVVVQKSTVPVGSCEQIKKLLQKQTKSHKIEIVSNPEFLREGSAVGDFMKPDRIVIGVENEQAEQVMRELYSPFKTKMLVADLRSAELIKYASNAFLSTKISFVNAIASICERTRANIEKVTEGMGLDKRIGPNFLKAGIGYGGSCFPKDVDALVKIAEINGYDFKLLKEVQRINKNQRRVFTKKVKEKIGNLRDKELCVWGLSFKPNTDDMREAPSIDIVEELQQEGANIRAFCPGATDTSKEYFTNINYFSEQYAALKGADGLLILTEWDHFKVADLALVKKMMKQPIVIDGRNIYDPTVMKQLGIDYISIGRGD